MPYFLAKSIPNEKCGVLPSHYLQQWVVLLPNAVPYILHTKFSDHYHGTTVTKTADVVQCTFSCTMMITMHH